MSHMTKIAIAIYDLVALDQACVRLGLTLTNKKTAQYYGREMDVDASITIPHTSYEIGVVKESDGSFSLHADFWDKTVRETIGEKGEKLTQMYAVEKAKAEARRKGFRGIYETAKEDGSIVLKIEV